MVGAAVEVQHHPLARHPGRDHPLRRNAIRVDRIDLRALGRRAGRPHQRAALLDRQGAQANSAHELKHGLELLTSHPGILRRRLLTGILTARDPAGNRITPAVRLASAPPGRPAGHRREEHPDGTALVLMFLAVLRVWRIAPASGTL